MSLVIVRITDSDASVCEEILKGDLDDQFPLVIWQTGLVHKGLDRSLDGCYWRESRKFWFYIQELMVI